MKTLLAFAALAVSTARAEFDMTQPAQVRVTVVDPAGRPVPDASILIGGATKTSDARGEASFILSTSGSGGSSLTVTKPGYADWRWRREGTLGLFPSAQVTRRVVLTPSEPTVINFQKPDGSPLPYVVFNLHERENTLVLTPYIADGNGTYRFSIDEDSSLFNLPTASPAFRRIARGSTTVVRFTPEELAKVPVAKPMEGTALLPDGKPAAGWIISWRVTTLHTGWSMMPGVENKQDLLEGTEFRLLPPDGSFSFHTYGDYVVLISPEGVAYRYPTPTADWPPGVHRQDLRVPALTAPIRGRLQFEDGSPAPGVSLILNGFKPPAADEIFWIFRPHETPSIPPIPAASFKTGQDGSFSLPAYTGADPRYNIEQGFSPRGGEIGKDSTVTIRRGTTAATSPKKHVLALFVDERGQPIPNFAEHIVHYLDVASGGRRDIGAAEDSRGVHFFVPTGGASIMLSPKRPSLSSVQQTIPITNTDDQTVRVTIPDAQRNLPLSGIILDPDGRSVAGATVSPFANRSGEPSASKEYFGMATKTDAQGRFSFDYANDDGGLTIYRYEDNGEASNLPGDLPEVTFTRDQRTLTIRLTKKLEF